MNKLKVLKAQILSELDKMQRLIDEAKDLQKKRASSINIRAGGSILHDFYTGAENIFHAIANTIDESVPSGMNWHTELLNQMTLSIEGIRDPVISKNTAKMLNEYLRFRHLFRKRYGFDLEWIHIKNLLQKMPSVYASFEREIQDLFKE
jgi:hypothetical protein